VKKSVGTVLRTTYISRLVVSVFGLDRAEQGGKAGIFRAIADVAIDVLGIAGRSVGLALQVNSSTALLAELRLVAFRKASGTETFLL